MLRVERFDGSRTPFEGDRGLTLRSVPDGARVSAARLTFTPVPPPVGALFDELITFTGAVGTWGATLASGGANPSWVEIDFHNRRTIARFEGMNVTGANLQLDLGGVYVEINEQGAVRVPDDDLFTVPSDGTVPGLTATKVKLTRPTGSFGVHQVRVRSSPGNVHARLGTGPPFYARPGELARPETTPDFAIALQEALEQAEVVDGFRHVALVVHSDSIARLDVTFEVEFVLEQNVAPGGLTESTLVYDFSSLPTKGSAPLVLTMPAGARLIESGGRPRALGAFEQSRVLYGPTGAVAPSGVLALAPARSLARPVTAPEDLAITSLDLLVAVVTRTATLQVDFVDDTDGKPWNEPLLPHPVTVTLDRDLLRDTAWVNVVLPAEFQLRAGRRLWLVVQSLTGEASWSMQTATGAPGTQQSVDGGMSWRAPDDGPALEGLLRLRGVPSRFTMPIELEVGEGASARRVSLARFEALGRVEIDLDASEVRGAINDYVATSTAHASCPTGEHVENGDFTAWRRTADLPNGTTRSIGIAHRATRVAVSADGCRAYAAGAAAGDVRMAAIDVFGDGYGGELAVDATHDEVLDLAVGPDGERVYALVGGGDSGGTALVVVARDGLSKPVVVPARGAVALAVSPDGATAYLAFGAAGRGRVMSFDSATIVEGTTPLPRATLELGGNGSPAGLAVDPTGALLAVTVADDDTAARVVLVDRATLTLTGDTASVPIMPRLPVISGDGSTLVLVHGPDRALSVTHLADLTVDTIALDDDEPTGAAVSADGRYGFVALAEGDEVAVVDIRAGRVIRRIPVGPAPAAIALTPDGERLFVADGTLTASGLATLTVLPIGVLVPEEWTVTAGRVRPVCLPPLGRIPVLGSVDRPGEPPAATTALAQVVPVSGGCRYELAFLGVASAAGATAEIHWLDAGCGRARTEVVAITAADARKVSNRATSGFVAHGGTFLAPDGAAQAELRFSAPAGILAAVQRVSLVATSDVLANGALAPAHDDTLAGWTLTPAGAHGVSAGERDGVTRLTNSGRGLVGLAQVVSLAPDTPYDLTVDGRATSVASAPKVTVSYLSSAGAPIGAPAVVVELTATGQHHAAHLPAPPSSVVSAEVRFELPAGASAEIIRLSLQPRAEVKVPLAFVAQSPGELTMTGWRAAFDVDERPTVPRPPADGLCRPRRPEPIAGEDADGEECHYCPSCEGEHDPREPTATHTPAGHPALATTCTNCAARVVIPGHAAHAPSAPRPHEISHVIARSTEIGEPSLVRARVLGLAPVLDTHAVRPIVAVNGIGERTATKLREIGIRDLVELASATVDDVSSIPGASPAMAFDWIEQAQRLISTP